MAAFVPVEHAKTHNHVGMGNLPVIGMVDASTTTTTTTAAPVLGSKGTGKTNKPAQENVACSYIYVQAQPTAPEYMTLVALCDYGQALGHSRGWVVNICGGDAGKKTAVKGAEVYSWGGRKFVKSTAKQVLDALK
jgi:hypothetical protein